MTRALRSPLYLADECRLRCRERRDLFVFSFFFLFLKEEEVKDFSKNIFCGIRICENDYRDDDREYSNIRDF